MRAYADLYELLKDARIEAIGRAAMTGQSVGFVTDSEPGKADGYVKKLLARFPNLKVASRTAGPVEGTVLIRVELNSVTGSN